MNLHDGPTGQAIKHDRNIEINRSNKYQLMRRKARYRMFPRLNGAPNPMAHRNAIWKFKKGMNA
jgi:hypothetical protein